MASFSSRSLLPHLSLLLVQLAALAHHTHARALPLQTRSFSDHDSYYRNIIIGVVAFVIVCLIAARLVLLPAYRRRQQRAADLALMKQSLPASDGHALEMNLQPPPPTYEEVVANRGLTNVPLDPVEPESGGRMVQGRGVWMGAGAGAGGDGVTSPLVAHVK